MIGRLFYVALGFFIGWVVFGHPDIANKCVGECGPACRTACVRGRGSEVRHLRPFRLWDKNSPVRDR